MNAQEEAFAASKLAEMREANHARRRARELRIAEVVRMGIAEHFADIGRHNPDASWSVEEAVIAIRQHVDLPAIIASIDAAGEEPGRVKSD